MFLYLIVMNDYFEIILLKVKKHKALYYILYAKESNLENFLNFFNLLNPHNKKFKENDKIIKLMFLI